MTPSGQHRLDRRSTVGDVYSHPLGRDIVDKLLLQLGRSTRWVSNPIVRSVRLGMVERLGRRVMGTDFLDTLLELLNDLQDTPTHSSGPVTPHWWKEAVFYQVYPRSFADSNGDGMGDVRGIIDHLDHLEDLGVDCVWLSPIFESPNEDNGYDISDYRAVMAEMGTLDDVDDLITACHDRGMRLILDLVVNHTSAQHAWFRAARQDPDGPYGDYYFLRPGEPDTLPNNWTSYFSGPAWHWLTDAHRWVLHLFATGQPDLNWDNPAVRREVADIVSWWLARGIDGFRLDVINFISKRPGLPPGNEFIGSVLEYTGVEHYFHGPHLHRYLAELRQNGFTRQNETGEGPGHDRVAVMIGETPGIGIEAGRLLTGADREELDLVFGFDHLENPGKTRWDDYRYDLNHLKRYMMERQSRLGSDDWVSLFWENHDNPRMISKINSDPRHRTALGKALAAIQLLGRGTPFIYQGQEIAAINQDFPIDEAFRDIESVNRLADNNGAISVRAVLAGSRDHARTPMRWDDDSPQHGFTTGEPWIGFHEQSTGFTVKEQREEPDSVLNFYRALITLRRSHRALRLGDIRYANSTRRDYFAWFRELDGETWFVEVNLSDRAIERPRRDTPLDTVLATGTGPRLGPYEARVHRVRV
ncbi:alpha-glucosidase [Tessaracoccus sp.]